MITAFIGIGSNLGNRESNIKRALGYIKRSSGITIEKVSKIIETEPQGGPPQGKYLNGVIKINTVLSARNLLETLQSIENRLGRVRSVRFGPRTIDLDILLYGNKVINEPGLEIPHPRMFERKFVLEPLFEIEPQIKAKIKIKELHSCI